MTKEDILQAIKRLAKCQGAYSAFYRELMDFQNKDPESFDKAMTMLEEKNFKDEVDLVLYLES